MAKRKTVTIYQENTSPIIILDDDERTVEEYSNSLSDFMSLSNISILVTSHSAVVIHPSKIISISVSEDDFFSEEDKEEEKKPKILIPGRKNKPIPKKEQMDIITDAD